MGNSLTPFEQWQLLKYGNFLPEPEINEDDTDDTDAENSDTILGRSQSSFPNESLGRNYPML